jgi:hypothetical protein
MALDRSLKARQTDLKARMLYFAGFDHVSGFAANLSHIYSATI